MAPASLHYTNDGIPILSDHEIDIRATKFLRHFDQSCLVSPTRSPIAQILERLYREYGVRVVLNQDLGYAGEKKVLGRIYLSPLVNKNTIYIDESITNHDEKFRFTAAHELGHFVLHRKRPIIKAVFQEQEAILSDFDTDLYLGSIPSKTFTHPKQWLEHQANKFAASLLMPGCTVLKAVKDFQKELGITRSLGYINLDRQENNRRDYEIIIGKLKLAFGISGAAAKIRLRELGILRITERARVYHISEIFSEP